MLACAGKTAGNIAEQFRFNQVFRDAAAVHLDKGGIGPQAVAVDMPGHNVLAHAGFAQQQHGCVRFCNGGGFSIQTLHDRALHHARVLVARDPFTAEILKSFKQFALRGNFFAQFGQRRDIADNRHHIGNLARGVLYRVPVKQQGAPVVEVLYT